MSQGPPPSSVPPATGARRKSVVDLANRVWSAAIALPVVAVAFQFNLGKLLLLLGVIGQCSYEYFRCVLRLYGGPGRPAPQLPADVKADRQQMIPVHVLLSMLPALVCYLHGYVGLASTLSASMILLACIYIAKWANISEPLKPDHLMEFCVLAFGHVYIDFLFAHTVVVHEMVCQWGTSTLVWVIATTILGDNGGYVGGKFFGRRRVTKAISPNKSLEGFIGAVAIACLSSVGFWFLFRSWNHPLVVSKEESFLDFVALGLLMGFFGIFGDLFESLIKRCFDVKDLGEIFPGWGGFMDRVDALIFTFPVVFYYYVIVRGYPLIEPPCATSTLWPF
jgi:phosphatidate cytidylyltransferase